MSAFDEAIKEFEDACDGGLHWKDQFGAAYMARIESTFETIKAAYEKVCAADRQPS